MKPKDKPDADANTGQHPPHLPVAGVQEAGANRQVGVPQALDDAARTPPQSCMGCLCAGADNNRNPNSRIPCCSQRGAGLDQKPEPAKVNRSEAIRRLLCSVIGMKWEPKASEEDLIQRLDATLRRYESYIREFQITIGKQEGMIDDLKTRMAHISDLSTQGKKDE